MREHCSMPEDTCLIRTKISFLSVSVYIIAFVPLCETTQPGSDIYRKSESEVQLHRFTVCIRHRHISRLHGDEFLVRFKVIIFRKNASPDELFLKRTDKKSFQKNLFYPNNFFIQHPRRCAP